MSITVENVVTVRCNLCLIDKIEKNGHSDDNIECFVSDEKSERM